MGAALACNAANMLVRRGHYERCAAVLADLLDGRTVQGQGLHLHIERAELQLRMGDAGRRAAQPRRRPRRCEEADEPAVVAALAAATAELLAQEGDRDGCLRTVEEALRAAGRHPGPAVPDRAAGDRAAQRGRARRAGARPRPDSAAAQRLDRLAAELDGWRRRRTTTSTTRAHHRTARQRAGPGPRDGAPPRTGAEAVAALADRGAPAGGGVLPAAGGRVPRRRQAAGQGGRRGDGRAARSPSGSGAAPIVAEVDALLGADPAVRGARAAHARPRTGPTD